jgi:hypothetical protein
MACAKVKKILDKLLQEPGVAGYSIRGNKIILYVEDEKAAATFSSLEIAGYEMEIKAIGRLQAL